MIPCGDVARDRWAVVAFGQVEELEGAVVEGEREAGGVSPEHGSRLEIVGERPECQQEQHNDTRSPRPGGGWVGRLHGGKYIGRKE